MTAAGGTTGASARSATCTGGTGAASGRRAFRLDGIDPRRTASFGESGPPCAVRMADGVARAVRTPAGPATMALRWNATGDVDASAWGDSAAVEWVLGRAAAWLGMDDDVDGWMPSRHPLVARLWRDHRMSRIAASGLVWDELVPTILAQRVTSVEARRSFRRLVWWMGEPAPGPFGLWLVPAPEVLATLNYVELHRFDIERRRADTLLRAARRASRLEQVAVMGVDGALAHLGAVDGVGAWTATSVVSACHGNSDLVVLGDYWLPTMVRYAFTGDRRRTTDDGEMLRLLEPFTGHRGRVCRLLAAAGSMPPRRAPRQRVRSFAAF